MTDADRFHIPPQIEAARYVDYMRGGQVLDLRPLIEHFEKELQLERNRVAVERTAASSAREALAACEERLKATMAERDSNSDAFAAQQELLVSKVAEVDKLRADIDYHALLQRERAEWHAQFKCYLQQIKGLKKRAQWAEDQAGKARSQRADALAELERERARFEHSLSALRSSATEQTVSLVPGSVEAVIEAYRLLVGDGLEWRRSPGWYDNTTCQSPDMEKATLHLIHWLDEHAPGGKP